MIKIFNRNISSSQLNNSHSLFYSENSCLSKTKEKLEETHFRNYQAIKLNRALYSSDSHEFLIETLTDFSQRNFSFSWNKTVFESFHKEILNSNQEIKCFIQPNPFFKWIPLDTPGINSSLLSFYSHFYSYQRFYTNASLVGEYEGKKVYSNYPKIFFQNFTNFCLAPNFSLPTTELINFEPRFTYFRKSKDRFIQSKLVHKHFNTKELDITKYQSCSSLDLLTISFETLHESLNSTKYDCLLLPSWSSKKDKNPSFVKLTANQTNKRRGLFVPVLTKINLLNENFEEEEVYYLSLALVTSKQDDFNFLLTMPAFKPSNLKAIAEFMDLAFFEQGLFFKSQDEYFEKKTSSLNSLLRTPLKNKIFSQATQTYLDNLLDVSTDFVKSPRHLSSNPISDDCLKHLSLNINSSAYVKLTNKLNSLKSKSIQKLRDQIETLQDLYSVVKINYIFYKDFVLTKYRSQKFLDLHPTTPLNDFNNSLAMLSSVKLAKANQNFFLTNHLQQALNSENQTNAYTDTLINLAKESVYVEEIIYTDSTTQKSITIDNTSTKNEVLPFLTSTPQQKIFDLIFVVDKIIPIYVDGKIAPKAIKAGGPYKVRLSVSSPSSFSLSVSPLNEKTIFAKDGNQYILHPHASSLGTENVQAAAISKRYANACLGEAVSTISWALQKDFVDLSHLILSIMLWLTSANSTDVWGKRYVHFPDYNDFDFESLPLIEQPSQEDIDTFLTSDDTTQEEIIELTQQPEENIETTTSTYTRYTPQ